MLRQIHQVMLVECCFKKFLNFAQYKDVLVLFFKF